jgi:DNA-directed RNA polymerase subunit RPC12/RpoP
MEKHICNICGLEFENHSLKANHIRWKHYDQREYIEKVSKMQKEMNDIKLGLIKEFEVECKSCGKKIIVKERELKHPEKEKYFCSRSCANKREHSKETLNKMSIGVKKCWKDPTYAEKCLKNRNNNVIFSSKGEREIRKILKERYGSKNVSSHRIVELNGLKKAVDLTIKSKNIIIEYDGIWHFDSKIYERMGTPEKYFEVIKKDKMVKEYCEINNIRLLRIEDKLYQRSKKKMITEIINFIEESELKYFELY